MALQYGPPVAAGGVDMDAVAQFKADAERYSKQSGVLMATAHDDEWKWLEGKTSNITSQSGEDGILAAIFDKIGTVNQCCFEVGAHDGQFFSNTIQWRDLGWKTLLMEADGVQYEQLKKFQSEHVDCVHCRICENRTLDAILALHDMPKDLDLGVIDIDGQDWWAWTDMEVYRPRVVMIEFAGAGCGGGVIPIRGDIGNGKGSVQAPEADILALGVFKKYKPIVSTGVNAIFIAEEAL